MNKHAVLVLSGGQDSATCGLWLKSEGYTHIHAVTFDYGQRHSRELVSAREVAEALGCASHEILDVRGLFANVSSLTDLEVPAEAVGKVDRGSLPNTFVPGRNILFLSVAASKAVGVQKRFGLSSIPVVVTGVCQTDYSGYPDCRAETIGHLSDTLTLAMDSRVTLLAPLMWFTKAQTVHLAYSIEGGREVIAKTWTCYLGWERPCGACPACALRAKGFAEAGEDDPALADH